MVTPLTAPDQLDVNGLERLLQHLEQGGVSALFILGTTGEGPGLSYRLRREMIDRVCDYAGERFPVLVGVADTSLVESLRLADYAARKGASAVVTTCPYYFPMSQGEYLSFLERVSPEYALPLFLYNLPRHVGFSIGARTARCAADLPNVWGLKDSSGDLDYFREVAGLLRERPEFSLLNGPEQILAQTVAMGAHGGVCGGANLYPKLYVGLYNAARDRNEAEIERLHKQVLELCDLVYTHGPDGSSYLRGIKCALELAGICSGAMAEPYSAFTGEAREKIGRALAAMGLLAASV